MQSNWRAGLGFTLVTAIMWGLLPLALKGLLGHMDPITLTWYRFSVSALIALLWYGHKSWAAISNLLSGQRLPLMILAIVGLLSNYLLYQLGLDLTNPSATQVVIQIAPVLLLLGSVAIFKETFSAWQWLGLLTFCLGIVLFFHHRLSSFLNPDNTSSDGQYLLGIALVVAASIAWAGYGLAQKKLLEFESANDILLILYIAGTICFLPFSEPSQIIQLGGFELGLLAFTSLNTIIAYGCFGQAMSHWEASRVSAIIPLAPLVTLIAIAAINHWKPGTMTSEELDLTSWLGGLLVVIGSITAALAKSSNRP